MFLLVDKNRIDVSIGRWEHDGCVYWSIRTGWMLILVDKDRMDVYVGR